MFLFIYIIVLYEELKLLRYGQSNSDRIQNTIWILIFFLLLLGNTFPRYNIFTRWRESRSYQQNFVSQETKSIFVTQDILTIKSDNYRESRTWKNLERVIENKKIFLLFHSRELESTIVPKRIFNNEIELNTFRRLANSE